MSIWEVFIDALIACAESLDLGISECLLVHIFALSRRSFARHDLRDKLLLILQSLIGISVECAFGDIAEDLDIFVLVALSDDSSGALLQICRSPRYIEVVDGNKPFLHVSTCTHLSG